jgi:hypothetical protein
MDKTQLDAEREEVDRLYAEYLFFNTKDAKDAYEKARTRLEASISSYIKEIRMHLELTGKWNL